MRCGSVTVPIQSGFGRPDEVWGQASTPWREAALKSRINVGWLRGRRQPKSLTRLLAIGGVACWLAGFGLIASIGVASANGGTGATLSCVSGGSDTSDCTTPTTSPSCGSSGSDTADCTTPTPSPTCDASGTHSANCTTPTPTPTPSPTCDSSGTHSADCTTPTPTPTPTGGAQGASTSSPSPSPAGAVLGASTTPITGAGLGILGGAALMLLGAAAFVRRWLIQRESRPTA